jgi:phosphohistidine phosphatase
MKTVFIVRHAKSSWESSGVDDHDRPLIQKGITRTLLVSHYLIENKGIPEKIISSTAVRASETACIIAKELGIKTESIIKDKRLYFEDAGHFFDLLYELPDEIQSVMLVGHNNAISEFAGLLLRNNYESMPTSAIVCMELQTEKWTEAGACAVKLKFRITPKMLK